MRWCIYLVVLVFAATLIGCGGSNVGTTDIPTATFDVPSKPGPEDAPKDASAVTYTGEYEDMTPDTWHWDMIYGQTMFLGSAYIVEDSGAYYMKYEMSDDAIADGWGFCDAAVDIVGDPADFPKNGAPGQFEWKWSWSPVYPDTPPTSYMLELTGWTPPAGDFYVAIHATGCVGSWVEGEEGWEWVETTNETGWGGVWDSKALDGETHWTGTWGKKWGGWYYTGDLSRYPIFDEFEKSYIGYHWGATSYWNINFNDNSPASFFFVPEYWQENSWQGWCSDPRYYGSGANVTVDVYSCYDPDLPDYAKSWNWDMISFMIDQRRDADTGGAFDGIDWTNNGVKQAFQDAVWYFKYGPDTPWMSAAADDYWYITITEGSLADSFIDYAIANGDGYFPRDGEWYAAVLWPLSGYNGQRPYTPAGFQTNIIEVDP